MALPQIGLEAVLLINKFQQQARQYNRTLEQLNKATSSTAKGMQAATGTMVKGFEELSSKSRVFAEVFQQLSPAGFTNFAGQVQQAMSGMGKNVKYNVAEFDRLLDSGASVQQALSGSAAGAKAAGASFTALGATLTGLGVAYGVAIKTVRDSIRQYAELAEEVRLLTLETGASAEEVSAWSYAAKLSGTSARSLATGFGQLAKNLTDLRLRQAEGSEESTAFERAMTALGVSTVDANGNLRDATSVMEDVRARLRELGPGITTTGLAMDIFGRTARDMLPFLLDTSMSMEDLKARAKELGISIGEEVWIYDEWRKATVDLKEATHLFSNDIAKVFLPLLTEVAKAGTTVITVLGKLSKFVTPALMSAGLVAATQDIAQAEDETTKARQKSLQALVAERLEEQALQDARQRTIDQLADVREQYAERILDIQQQFSQRWEDIELTRARQIEDINRDLNRRLEDMAIDLSRRREDIYRDHAKKLADIEADRREKIADLVVEQARQREDLERKHQERLLQIQLNYQDALGEAVRRNDAVAVLQAMRRRASELRDATRQQQQERTDLQQQQKERRQQVEDDAQKARQKERERLQESLDDLARYHERQLEDMRLAQARADQDRAIAYARELEDFNKAKQRQLEAADAQYRKQRDALIAQLNDQRQVMAQGIIETGQAAANATSAAIRTVAQSAYNEIQRWGHLLPQVASQGIVSSTAANLGTTTGPTISMAEGGMVVASKPTMVMMGDSRGGPEIGVFAPLARSSLDVNFSRLGVDLNGVPGNMDMRQVQSIVVRTMETVMDNLLRESRR